MSFRPLKMLIVTCIALLQCLVPLIHAHAHEVAGMQHVHIHLEGLGAGAQPAANQAIQASDVESAAIGVTQEFKRDHFLLPILGAAVAIILLVALVSRSTLPPFRAWRGNPSPLYCRPPATAPPAQTA